MRRYGVFAVCGGLMLTLVASSASAQQGERETDVEVRNRRGQVEVEVESQREAPRAERTREAGERAPQRISQLSDFHLASWIILENDVQLRISEFAQQKARNASVKQYAQRMVQSHDQLVNQLHQPLRQFSRQQEGVEFDFAAVLNEVTGRLQELDRRQRLGYRGADRPAQPGQETEQPAETDSSRRRLLEGVRNRLEQRQQEAEREDVNEQREDLRDARRDREILDDNDQDDERVREQREQLRDERQELRRERRDDGNLLDGDLRAAVRENLPEILGLIEEAVEASGDENSSGLAFIQLKRELSDKYAQSVMEEIKKQPEGDFDQAYLGFEVANHLRLIDTMEVAKRHASPELGQTLDKSIAAMHEHLDQARNLMREIGTHRDVPREETSRPAPRPEPRTPRTDRERQE